MALISAGTIIRSASVFHLTLAYFLLVSPKTIANHNLVFILGAAMGLPNAPSLVVPNAMSAFLAAVLALIGISDLTAVSMREEVASLYWGSQAPIRLLFFFILTGYTYLAKAGGPAARHVDAIDSLSAESLINRFTFTWGFLEMVTWFWIYVTLRDERREMLTKAAEKRKLEEERNLM